MEFDFNRSLTLENDHALLRSLNQNDFEKLLPFSENEPNLWDFSLTPASGVKNLKNYIKNALDAREKKESKNQDDGKSEEADDEDAPKKVF